MFFFRWKFVQEFFPVSILKNWIQAMTQNRAFLRNLINYMHRFWGNGVFPESSVTKRLDNSLNSWHFTATNICQKV